MRELPKPLIWAGMTLMLATAFAHLIGAPYAFEDAWFKGGLLVVVAISALLAATGIQEGAWVWGWGLGSLVAVVAIAGYMTNSTVGLPGLPADTDAWQNPFGIAAVVAEGLLVLLAVGAFGAARYPLRPAASRRSA